MVCDPERSFINSETFVAYLGVCPGIYFLPHTFVVFCSFLKTSWRAQSMMLRPMALEKIFSRRKVQQKVLSDLTDNPYNVNVTRKLSSVTGTKSPKTV